MSKFQRYSEDNLRVKKLGWWYQSELKCLQHLKKLKNVLLIFLYSYVYQYFITANIELTFIIAIIYGSFETLFTAQVRRAKAIHNW